MEIASDDLITEAEKERTRKVLNELCQEACASLSDQEAKTTARTTFHDAVTAAAKKVAEGICADCVPIANEIVAGMLKDSGHHAYVQGVVNEATQPVARNGAYAAIRRWSEEQAMPKAEEAARKVITEHMENGYLPTLHTAVLAGIRAILENKTQISAAERESLIDEYLAGEAKRAAVDIVARGMTAELRRMSQRAAEIAVEEVASKATDSIAREEALDAARVVAIDTAKLEISRLVLAEAQRRAARLAREKLQAEAAEQDEDKRMEYCQEVAKQIAAQAVNSVTEEIADPSVADLDLDKAKELALSAASAVAREFSGAYQMTPDDETLHISVRTLIFLGVQIFVGCFIVWFFLLGGYDVCEPMLRTCLPPDVYHMIYKAVPHHTQSTQNSKSGVEVDDLLDEPKPGDATKEGAEDEVPTTKPESTQESPPTPPADSAASGKPAPENTSPQTEKPSSELPVAPESAPAKEHPSNPQ